MRYIIYTAIGVALGVIIAFLTLAYSGLFKWEILHRIKDDESK